MITPMRVFVLLFNARTENEGIHTIRVDNLRYYTESEDDATRFAVMEAQDFPLSRSNGCRRVKEFAKCRL